MKMELRFRKDRDRSRKYGAVLKAIGGWVLRIAVVCVLAFWVVRYLGQWRSVVGDSMNPVLHVCKGCEKLYWRTIPDVEAGKRISRMGNGECERVCEEIRRGD